MANFNFLFIIFILVLFSNMSSSQNLDSLLIGHWPFNGNAIDESVNNNDGFVLGATLTNDRFGNENGAYHFDGNDRIDVPDDPSLTLGSEFTMVVWAQMSSYGADGGYYLMGHSEGPGNTKKWIFWFGNDGISLIMTHSGGGWIWLGNFAFELNNWYCLAIMRNGNNLSAYVNGVNIGSNTISSSTPNPAATLQFGTAEPDRPNRVLRGKIDNIKIYSRVLSEEEIMMLCNRVSSTHDFNLNSLKIEVNPNPNSGKFTFQFEKEIIHPLTITIHNNLGEKIQYQELEKGTTSFDFNLPDQRSGIYYATIQDAETGMPLKTEKFIIQ